MKIKLRMNLPWTFWDYVMAFLYWLWGESYSDSFVTSNHVSWNLYHQANLQHFEGHSVFTDYKPTRGHGKLCLSWFMNLWGNWIFFKWTFFQHCQTEHFLSNSVKIEKLLVKKNHLDTKLWTTLRSPRKARLNQGTLYSQGKVSSFQGRCLLSYLNGWCGSYLRTTKGCRTRYLKSSGLYI